MARWNGMSPSRPRSRQDGSASLEMVLIVPVLLMVFLLVVGLGRMANARQEVEAVASDAARAASLERNTFASTSAAVEAAHRSLDSAGMSCQGLNVDVDVSNYQPGGQVTVTVSCTAQLRDVALSGLPGSKEYEATATVPIETYRGG